MAYDGRLTQGQRDFELWFILTFEPVGTGDPRDREWAARGSRLNRDIRWSSAELARRFRASLRWRATDRWPSPQWVTTEVGRIVRVLGWDVKPVHAGSPWVWHGLSLR